MHHRSKTTSSRWKKAFIAAAVSSCLWSHVPAYASGSPTGELKGSVKSISGEILENAVIRLQHLEQGFTREVQANVAGEYVFKNLPVGQYSVTISKSGYDALQQEKLVINVGSTVTLEATLTAGNVERITVSGARLAQIDMTSAASGLVVTSAELEKLPVAEDITSVVLIAPGSSAADSDFGNIASISGASAAENGYYLNGLDITDMRKGMGWTTFPWEAVKETQVITGGVSSQFGRFIGGVTNLVSKSGSNEFHASVKFDYQPRSLAETALDLNWYDNQGRYDLIINNHEDSSDWRELSMSFSGPLIEDRLFFYVLYAPSQFKSTYANPGALLDDDGDPINTTYWSSERDRDQVFANIDFYLFSDHSINVMYANSKADHANTQYSYNVINGPFNPLRPISSERESSFASISYRGSLTDTLSFSTTLGKIKDEYSAVDGTSNLTPIYDSRTSSATPVGNWIGTSDDVNGDERDVFRIDFEWQLDEHTLRFGYDKEQIDSWRDFHYHGPTAPLNEILYYFTTATGFSANGDNGAFSVPAGDYARGRIFTTVANIRGESEAWYIEDVWQLTDTVTLSLGVRNEIFSNYTGQGEKYVEIDDQWAPRLSAIWDVFGDGDHKAFLNFGRYYQPIAQNTGVRMTAQEYNIYTYYPINDFNADGTANLGTPYGQITYGDGTLRPGWAYASTNMEPMYEDEWSLGYEWAVDQDWTVGARLIYRDLKSSIEDSAIWYAVEAWCADTGRDCSGYDTSSLVWNGGMARVFNPGQDLRMLEDLNGDGTPEEVTIPAEYLGYPVMERTYKALELTWKGKVGESFRLQGSYTYSKSEGNTEGLLRSDNDQSDPGWTRSYDSPELTDHAYGYLPNDHRHKFKLWGTYQLTEDTALGMFYSAQSGRPMNAFGYHPLDEGACVNVHTDPNNCWDAWGAENFYAGFEPSPRGSRGRTPWVQSFDVSLQHVLSIGITDLTLKLDVINVFNWQHATQLNEYHDVDGDPEAETYSVNSTYGKPTAWQTPRYVNLSARVDF